MSIEGSHPLNLELYRTSEKGGFSRIDIDRGPICEYEKSGTVSMFDQNGSACLLLIHCEDGINTNLAPSDWIR